VAAGGLATSVRCQMTRAHRSVPCVAQRVLLNRVLSMTSPVQLQPSKSKQVADLTVLFLATRIRALLSAAVLGVLLCMPHTAWYHTERARQMASDLCNFVGNARTHSICTPRANGHTRAQKRTCAHEPFRINNMRYHTALRTCTEQHENGHKWWKRWELW
jgi:hypothetical protein